MPVASVSLCARLQLDTTKTLRSFVTIPLDLELVFS